MDDVRHQLPTNSNKFMHQLRLHMREQGLAYRTEQTYTHWIKNFIRFHRMKHPKDMGAREVEAYLTHLGVSREVRSALRRSCSIRSCICTDATSVW